MAAVVKAHTSCLESCTGDLLSSEGKWKSNGYEGEKRNVCGGL